MISAPVVIRAAAGLTGAALAGWMAFRTSAFQPGRPAFQCIKVGLVASILIALVRLGRLRPAAGMCLLWVGLEAARVSHLPLHRAFVAPSWAAGTSLGLLSVALVYRSLSDQGIRFGKFLVIGPMIGAVFVAVTPIALIHAPPSAGVARELWFNALLGIVIGDGVGFGVEMVDVVLPAPRGSGLPGVRSDTVI